MGSVAGDSVHVWPSQPAQSCGAPWCVQQPVTLLGGLGCDWWDVGDSRYLGGDAGEASAGQLNAR